MKRLVFVRCHLLILLVLCSCISFGQDSGSVRTIQVSDSIQLSPSKTKKITPAASVDTTPVKIGVLNDVMIPKNKKRIRLVAAGNILGYGGSMIGLYSTWYANYPQSSFHFFNDNKEWQQVDKIGHAYSSYIEGKGSMEMWRWAGLSRKQTIWIGGMSGALYQTVIETLDGFSSEWGWSWGDFGANIFGSSILVSQELVWNEQRISFKFSTHKKNYSEPQLNQRSKSLYGSSFSETFLKDYNAQSYWLSANLKSFFKKSTLPAWLNIAVGYGAEGMFGAEKNTWTDKNGNTIDRTDIPRYRQFFLSPDIDLTRIKTKSKVLKVAFFVLNSFKFPAPSLELSRGKLIGHWIHF